MTKRTSPTVRRRRLAAELRRLRKESGKTREDAARFAGIAPMTVTRLEAGQHAPKPGDITMLCRFYELDDARTEVMVTLARESRLRGWWHSLGGSIPEWFQIYVGLEEEAATIRTYQPEAIPGLLQIEEYARAIYLAEPTVLPEEEIERRIAVRMGRQKRLLEAGDAPHMWIVLNQAVLHRQVGGKEATRKQLEQLLRVSRLNTVTLQVLSYESGAHPGMHGAFVVLGFPEPADPDVVYLEYRQGSLYLEKPTEIDGYTLIFDHLRAQALGRDESRALIAQVVREMA